MWGRLFSAAAAALLATGAAAGPADTGPINSRIMGDLVPTHDPVLAKEGRTYYVYGTGGHYLTTKTSPDLIHWTAGPPAIPALPDWAQAVVPGTKDMWAPDLSFWNGQWHLYYALSTFGSNRSAIGLFTSPTLDPKRADYRWRDEGLVVQSRPSDDFNAIDPNHFIDAEGRHWLALGSFWGGIKLFELDGKSGKLKRPGERPFSLARRLVPAGGPDPVEGAFLIRHDGYYYLFASYDYCCKGVNSTYYAVYGRSKDVTGPYLGRDGSSMLQGGGTIILRGDLQEQNRFRGPGHNGFLHDSDGQDYLVYHAYDKANHGAPTLRISPVRWTADGWPEAVQ